MAKSSRRGSNPSSAKQTSGIRECCPVTMEELHFAYMAAGAAAAGRTPRQSFLSKKEEAIASGKLDPSKQYVFLTDDPANHAGFAIMELFPGKSDVDKQKRLSLLWRALSLIPAVMVDPRAAEYLREEADGHQISAALLTSMATIRVPFGADPPLDDIFAEAGRLNKNWPNGTAG